MFGLTPSQIVGATVLAAIITVTGNLVALYLKEVLTVRSFERWKSRQTLLSVYRRYQLPIFMAAQDLAGRAYGLARPDNDREIRKIGLDILEREIGREQHAMVSDHYLQYRFVSNAYRLCSFLGWTELYRRDIGTLDVDALDRNHQLEACLMNIRCAIADGWINQHDNIAGWRDTLIFREELRAIGHRMAADGSDLALLDFGSFWELLRNDPKGAKKARWFVQAAHFYENLERTGDFRIVRLRMILVFLTDMMEVLQPGRIKRSHIETAIAWYDKLDEWTGGGKWQPDDCDMPAVRARLAKAAKLKPNRWR